MTPDTAIEMLDRIKGIQRTLRPIHTYVVEHLRNRRRELFQLWKQETDELTRQIIEGEMKRIDAALSRDG